MEDKIFYSLLDSIADANAQKLVEFLKDKKDVNEFKIADKLGITINQARNILYKLSAQDMVSFIRKKDKRKGWYIYYWTLNMIKVLELLQRIKKKEIEQQAHFLKSRKTKRFFICEDCQIELTEENAMHNNFFCQECGQLLRVKDNKDKITEIEKIISKNKKELSTIREELDKLRDERQKKEERAAKRLKAKRKKKRERIKKRKVKKKKRKKKGKRKKAKKKAKKRRKLKTKKKTKKKKKKSKR